MLNLVVISLPTFRDNLSVLSSEAKNPKKKAGHPSTGFIQGRMWVLVSSE